MSSLSTAVFCPRFEAGNSSEEVVTCLPRISMAYKMPVSLPCPRRGPLKFGSSHLM